MKTIYLDSDYMCYLKNADGRIEVQTDVFDETVDEAIPYYRYIPDGVEWTNNKGQVFHGPFIQATNSKMIDQTTTQSILEDVQLALAVLGIIE